MESVDPIPGSGADRAREGIVARVPRSREVGPDDSRPRTHGDAKHNTTKHGAGDERSEAAKTATDSVRRDQAGDAAELASAFGARPDRRAVEPIDSAVDIVFGGRPMTFTDVRASGGSIATEHVEFEARVIENDPERRADDPASRFPLSATQRRFRSAPENELIEPGAAEVPSGSPADIGRRFYARPPSTLGDVTFASVLA